VTAIPIGEEPCVKITKTKVSLEAAKCAAPFPAPAGTEAGEPVDPIPVEIPLHCTAMAAIPVLDDDNCQTGTILKKCYSDGTEETILPDELLLELQNMGATLTPYVPTAGAETCRQAQVTSFEIIGDDVEQPVSAIIAAAIADAAPEFTLDAPILPVPAAAEDVYDFNMIVHPCGATDSAGAEVIVDFAVVNGVQVSKYHDGVEGGIDADALVTVPTGGCATVSICFKKCWDKAELAALPAG
jgi:hypothetical protein